VYDVTNYSIEDQTIAGRSHKLENFVSVLRYRSSHQSTQVAYRLLDFATAEHSQVTYAELDRLARSIAVKISATTAPGERALLLYPPGLDFIAAFFGCLYAGVIAVPAYPPRRNQNLLRLQSIISNAQPSLVLTTGSLLENWISAPEFANLLWITTDSSSLDADFAENWQEPKIRSEDLAFLQYTSGSTGMPKGVMVSHGNLMHNSLLIQRYFGINKDSCGVNWLPLYHDMGLIGGVLQPLYGGNTMTLMSALDFLQKPLRWLEAISQERATTSGAPNFAYDLCVRKIKPEQLANLDLSNWSLAFTGAEPVRAETIDNFSQKFAECGFRREAFYPCYGMAETTLIVTGGEHTQLPKVQKVDNLALELHRVKPSNHPSARSLVSCGQCVGQKISIVDPQTLSSLAENQVGEVWVLGASVAQGYWQQSALTATTFCAYTTDGSGPFLRTGDLGFIRDGELYITGRIKDVIIVRGQNHYPQDIELTVEGSHPALKPWGGAAFALDRADGERLVVVHEVERSYLRQLPASEIMDSIRQAVVAEHGIPVYGVALLKTGSIPKTSSGKIQRYACRDSFLKGSLSVVADWSEDPQIRSEFIQLQADVQRVLQQVTR
jgi:acyl-CoA synthetase (AMP-forming)/AMP-acid ligase II